MGHDRVNPTERVRSGRVCARLALAAQAVVLFGMPASVSAFTEPRTYFESAQNGGGGGRFFTASPAEGYGCGVCHTGSQAAPLRVRGLPEEGYVPGDSYDVRISWPDFTKRSGELEEDGQERPRMGLLAELVADTGEGSGSLEIAGPSEADESELCIVPEDTQAAQLYQVRPGETPVEETIRCESSGLGQRCIVAVLACGASELRFRWTAPAQWQETIWFSAGFVSTEEVSGDAQGDAVRELVRPILPAASNQEHHQTQLYGGCSAAAGPVGAGTAWPTSVLGMLGWALGRRRRR